MSETSGNSPEALSPILEGEPLPGLLVHESDRPEGVHYWDQVLPSPLGTLYYAPDQVRNGTIGWVTNHGECRVTVESYTGKVIKIDEEFQKKIGEHYTRGVYETGMEAHQE